MDEDDLYWETGVSGRTPYRRFFRGWQRAYDNCKWWVESQPNRSVYIGVYGCRKLRDDGTKAGFKRSLLPDYRTAVVDKIFLDIDCHDESKEAEYHEDVALIENWLDSQDIRRRWIFTGGGMHYLIAAEGRAENVDNAIFHIITKVIKHQMVDPVAFDIERMRRFPGSFNKKRGCFVIPLKSSELSLSIASLREVARVPRNGSRESAGRYPISIDELERCVRHEKACLGEYDRQIISQDKETVLNEYGIDWDSDFCPAMKSIIMKENPSNFERLQLFKYLNSILKIPFVDVFDSKKTVMNLVYNILNDKVKATHAIQMAEAESVYKRDRVFHPQKLRLLGYCEDGCSQCLDRRQVS